MTVQYTDPAKVTEVAKDETCRPNPYASGYGPQIPTSYRIRYPQRWYRVYVSAGATRERPTSSRGAGSLCSMQAPNIGSTPTVNSSDHDRPRAHDAPGRRP